MMVLMMAQLMAVVMMSDGEEDHDVGENYDGLCTNVHVNADYDVEYDDNDGIPDDEDVDDDNDGIPDDEDYDNDDEEGDTEEESGDGSEESSANVAGLSLALCAIVLGRFA